MSKKKPEEQTAAEQTRREAARVLREQQQAEQQTDDPLAGEQALAGQAENRPVLQPYDPLAGEQPLAGQAEGAAKPPIAAKPKKSKAAENTQAAAASRQQRGLNVRTALAGGTVMRNYGMDGSWFEDAGEETAAAPESGTEGGERVLRVKVPEVPQIGLPWETNGPKGLGANGHVSNEQLNAMMLGAQIAQKANRDAALTTNHKMALNEAYQDVSIWLTQQAADLANADPQTIQTKLASIEQKLSTNAALSPFADGLTPEMRLERQQALQDTLYKFTMQVERQRIETQIEQDIVNASEEMGAITARTAQGEDSEAMIGEALRVYNRVAPRLSPARRSDFLQKSLSGIGEAAASSVVADWTSSAAGAPVDGVQDKINTVADMMDVFYGVAGETLGGPLNAALLEIMKVKGTETAEKAGKALRDYNMDVFKGRQAAYEAAITQGNSGTARAIAGAWSPQLARARESGALSVDDSYATRDYFKPFTEAGTGGGAGGGGSTVYKGPVFDKMGKTLAEAVLNYLQVPTSPLPKDVFEALSMSVIAEAEAMGYGLNKDIINASIWREAANNLRTLNTATLGEAQGFIDAVQGDATVINAQVLKTFPKMEKNEAVLKKTVEDWQGLLYLGALEIIASEKSPEEFRKHADNFRTKGFADLAVIMDAEQSKLAVQLERNEKHGVKFEALESNIVNELKARQQIEADYGIGHETTARAALTDDNQRALDIAVLGLFRQQMENLMPFISDMNLRYESGVPVIDVLRTGGSRARYVGRIVGKNKLVFEDEAEHGR